MAERAFIGATARAARPEVSEGERRVSIPFVVRYLSTKGRPGIGKQGILPGLRGHHSCTAALNSGNDFHRSRRAGALAGRTARRAPRPRRGDRAHVGRFALRPVAAYAAEEAQAEIEGHDLVFRK